jgi:guanylate kinase
MTTRPNWNEPSHGPDYKNVTPRELKEKLSQGEELVLLDVREPWEFYLAD